MKNIKNVLLMVSFFLVGCSSGISGPVFDTNIAYLVAGIGSGTVYYADIDNVIIAKEVILPFTCCVYTNDIIDPSIAFFSDTDDSILVAKIVFNDVVYEKTGIGDITIGVK